jgi:hypothetical protein
MTHRNDHRSGSRRRSGPKTGPSDAESAAFAVTLSHKTLPEKRVRSDACSIDLSGRGSAAPGRPFAAGWYPYPVLDFVVAVVAAWVPAEQSPRVAARLGCAAVDAAPRVGTLGRGGNDAFTFGLGLAGWRKCGSMASAQRLHRRPARVSTADLVG